MKKNNPIIRTCIVCRKKDNKDEFFRIVKTSTNEIILDENGKSFGRGCYVCKNEDCCNKLKKNKALNRAYKTNITEVVYDKLQQSINNKKD